MPLKISSLIWVFTLCASLALGQEEIPHPGPRSAEEANALYSEGTVALTQKNFAEAARDFERLISRYPSDAKIMDAYLSLLEALYAEKKFSEIAKFAKQLLHLKPDQNTANRARTYLAEAELGQQEYLEARSASDELLANSPTPRQQATAHTVKFQALLEEKQYSESRTELETLTQLLSKEPVEPFTKLLPEYKMVLAIRECTISHLVKDAVLAEDEITDYFSGKNLCFKTALVPAAQVSNEKIVHEWCESFTNLHHELERLKTEPDIKQKVEKDLKATFEFSNTINPNLSKCYEPLPPPAKNKKRHRKRRLHKSRRR